MASVLGTVVKDADGIPAGTVVELKKERPDGEVEVEGNGGKLKGNVPAKNVVPFPIVAPAPDPASSLNSLEIVPIQWYLRNCWFNDLKQAWPNGLAGTHFADPSMAECTAREVIVPPFDKGGDVFQHTKELSRSIKLILDADHGYSATFQPTGNKDIPHAGPDMGPQLVGLYAEKTTGERDKKTGKLKVIGDVFIPLSAIVQDPATYCDRTKFPRFYDHSPDITNLKAGLAKPISRSEDKEADFGVGFKTYIAELRSLTFKMVALLISVHAIVTLFYGLVVGTIVAVPLAYVLKTSWAKTQARLKQLWTIQYPIYREYWRFKKDDEMARQFNYNFPFFANHPLLRSMLGYLFKTPDHTTMSANFLPPDITHENKGVGGSKEGDTKVQYVVFTFVLCYIAHYTPLVGLAVERTAAFVFLVLPVAADRGSAILAEVMEGATTYYERYGLSYYLDELIRMATTLPDYGRRTAQIWTRKVLYGDIWRKNRAVLELPEVGDETYSAVMPELFKICEEEYGFEHKDERVCKAMFKRTEDKHVENVEHFTFLILFFALPLLVLTPKDRRSTSFFVMLPVAFIACFVMIPHELRNSLTYFEFEGSNSSRHY